MLPFTPRECTRPWQIPGNNLVVPVGMHVIIPIVNNIVVKKNYSYCLPRWVCTLIQSTGLTPSLLIRRGSVQKIGEILTVSITNHFDLDQGLKSFSFHVTMLLVYRACLGQNLAKMKSKILLIELLRNHRYEISELTRRNIYFFTAWRHH